MLTFHLKTKYYRQIYDGEKTHEYRPCTDHWDVRISKLKAGDEIQFKLGYTSEGVVATVVFINSVHVLRIPIANELFKIYGAYIRYYYDIEFKLKR